MYPILQVFGLEIPTYYFVISVTVIICAFVLEIRRQRKFNFLDRERVHNLLLIICISGFIGGRLGHVAIEAPIFYWNHPEMIGAFWQGGFVFYGGFVFAILSSCLYLRKDLNFWSYLDLFTPIAALGYALGRWACFFAGCCYGSACNLPWAVHGLHPTQIYASVGEFLILLSLMMFEKYQKKNHKGDLFFVWLIFHALNRMMMEHFRADFRGPVWFFTPSSWFSIVLLCYGLFHFRMGSRKKLPRKHS